VIKECSEVGPGVGVDIPHMGLWFLKEAKNRLDGNLGGIHIKPGVANL
jgi:hypothetical protein